MLTLKESNLIRLVIYSELQYKKRESCASFQNFRFSKLELLLSKMLARSDGVQAKSFHIFHDDKFIPSRMTGEIAVDTYSSPRREYYHAGACAKVPFIWESQPGTPNHRLRQTPLPPLTPPPSFFSPSATAPSSKKTIKNRKYVFPKFSFVRSHHPIRLSTTSETSTQSLSSSSPSCWSTSSPTVLPSPVTPLCDYYYCRRYGFQFEAEEEKSCLRSSSNFCSTFLCFSSEKCNRRTSARKSAGRYSCMFKRLIGISTP